MDPNAALKEIDSFIEAKRHGDEVDEWVNSLRDWLAGGGVEPNWKDYPSGTAYFHVRMAVGEKLAKIPA